MLMWKRIYRVGKARYYYEVSFVSRRDRQEVVKAASTDNLDCFRDSGSLLNVEVLKKISENRARILSMVFGPLLFLTLWVYDGFFVSYSTILPRGLLDF